MRGRTDGLKRGEGWIKERPRVDGSIAYQAGWLDADGRQRTRTFPSRDAAEDHLRQQQRAKRDGRYAAPSDLTVARAVADWLDRGAGGWSPNTRYVYRSRAKANIVPQIGALRVQELTKARLQHWLDRLVAVGVAPGTLHLACVVLKAALDDAVDLGVIASNPAAGLRRPSLPRARAATWTEAEQRRVLAHVAGDRFWRPFFAVALATGVRPGELRALQWRDLDLADGVIRVRRTITRDDAAREVIGETTKGKRERAVAIPAEVVDELRAWRVAQTERRLAAAAWTERDLVFDGGRGGVLPARRWSEKLAEVAAACDVPRLTRHQLRHTHATLALAIGEHPVVVADRLGHASVKTTLDTYQHSSPALQRAFADEVGRRLFGDPEATTSRERSG